jgi:hypothetical protein
MNAQSSKVRIRKFLKPAVIASMIAGAAVTGGGPAVAQSAGQGPFTFSYPTGYPAEYPLYRDPTTAPLQYVFSTENKASNATLGATGVPSGFIQTLAMPANGTQDYVCRANATGFGWAFTGPRANLFDAPNQQFSSYKFGPKFGGTHYNLQGTSQAGTGADGPRWRFLDGTLLRGRVLRSAPGRTSGDIPNLLLSVEVERPSAFNAYYEQYSFIQRVETKGGVAPAGGCGAATVGAVAQVPYSATYNFFAAPKPDPYGTCDEYGNYCPA